MAPPRTLALQDAAMASSSTSPASLLWGHQLKREHGFLLDRMNKIENGHHAFDNRIRSTEAAAEAMKSAVGDVKRLTEASDEVDDARAAWIGSAETRLEILKESIEKFKNLQPRVSELEAQFDGMEDQVQQSLSNQQSILQKIRALETEMQGTRVETGNIMKKNDPSNARVLVLRLDAMESHRKEDERKAKALLERVADLEKSCQVFNAQNNELQDRLNAALEARDYPLPSAEIATQIPASAQLPTQVLPSTEAPTQVLPSIEIQTQALQSTEVPTQVLPSSNSIYVQMPESSPFVPTHERTQGPFRDESPGLSAQLRKNVKAARTVRPKTRPSRQNARVLKTQVETQTPTLTPDLDAPYRRAHAPNSRKRRRPVPVYEPPQTRSQTRSQVTQRQPAVTRRPTMIVVLKLPQGKKHDLPVSSRTQPSHPTRPSRVMKRSQSPQTKFPSAGKGSTAPKRDRIQGKPRHKPREVQQLKALETFLTS